VPERGETNEPPTLDYQGPDRQSPPGFCDGVWPEIRSELTEIPLWLLIPFGVLLLTVAMGFGCLIYGVITFP
jgi:hypothetical protein